MKIKRAAAVLLASVLALSFTACGEKEQSEQKTYSHEITANVIDADGTAIVIQNGDESITFNYEGVDVQNFDNRDMDLGEDQGDVAIITYTGEMDGTGTGDCKVTNMAIQPAEEKTLKAHLVDIVSTRSQITVNDGNTDMRFDVSDAERYYSSGLRIGDELVITYMGEINGSDTSKAYVCGVCDAESKTDKIKTQVDVEQVNEKVWTKAPANLREGSSQATETALSVEAGEKLTRTGIGDDGWSRVEYDGKSYCVLSSSLTKKKPSEIVNDAEDTDMDDADNGMDTDADNGNADSGDDMDVNEDADDNGDDEGNADGDNAEGADADDTDAAETGGVITGSIRYLTVNEDSTSMQFYSECRYYNFDISEAELRFLGDSTTGTQMMVTYTGDMTGGTGTDIRIKSVDTLVSETEDEQ